MKTFMRVLFVFAFVFANFASATVNLNTASQSELEALPGVGAKMATAIMEARPLKSVEDLKNIKGVGDAKFEKLKSLVSVEGAAAAVAPSAPAPTTSNVSVENKATEVKKTNSAAAKLAPGQVLNLNSASVADLEKLPGIGQKKAEAIVAARPFEKVEDVMKVKGIKEGIFKKIQPYISVR